MLYGGVDCGLTSSKLEGYFVKLAVRRGGLHVKLGQTRCDRIEAVPLEIQHRLLRRRRSIYTQKVLPGARSAMATIQSVKARQIFDSRGNPTVEVRSPESLPVSV